MAEPMKVFVSYSRKDLSFVEKLLFELERAGVDVWSDREVRLGQLWDEQVRNALAEADVFVLVVSPDYFTSNWSMVEMGAALARAREGAIIVPVTRGPVELPLPLRVLHGIDARSTTPAEIAGQIREITSKD